jgi:hypothetical protein
LLHHHRRGVISNRWERGKRDFTDELMTRVTVLLLALIASGCTYGVSFEDCQLTCMAAADCPDGFDCRDNLCRAGGAMGACTAPGSVTLRQTDDDTVDRNLIFACTNGDGTTAATSWYRLFSLAESEVFTPFHVDHATLGISFSVGQPLVIANLYTYTGGSPGDNQLDLANAALVDMATITPPETQITELVTIPLQPVVIPAGSLVLLEIRVTDQLGTGRQINIGSTDAKQGRPGYFLTPLCGTTTPTSTQAANHPDARFVLTLTGTR